MWSARTMWYLKECLSVWGGGAGRITLRPVYLRKVQCVLSASPQGNAGPDVMVL